MARDSKKMRGSGPFLFAQVTNGIGVREIADELLGNWRAATRLQLAERE
jgi:urease accessory protein